MTKRELAYLLACGFTDNNEHRPQGPRDTFFSSPGYGGPGIKLALHKCADGRIEGHVFLSNQDTLVIEVKQINAHKKRPYCLMIGGDNAQ